MTMLSQVPDVLRSLLPELAESLGEYLGQARTALEGRDGPAAAAAAHAVKGAAMRFGLPAMAEAAGELEERCRGLQATPPAKDLHEALSALGMAEAGLAGLHAALSEQGGDGAKA